MNETAITLPPEFEHMRPVVDALSTALGNLTREIDPDQRQTELDEKLEPYRTGPWKFAPASERRNAQKEIIADQDRRAGIALYGVESSIRELTPQLDVAARRARQAPDAEAAWLARTEGKLGLNAQSYLLLGIADELRRQRLTSELHASLPSEVLARYASATEDPTEQLNATTIRLIEELHGNGWRGALPTDRDEREVQAMRELKRSITTAQESRLPPAVGELQDLLTRARKLAQRAQDVHKVHPIKE